MSQQDENEIEKAKHLVNFGFVIPNKLAGCRFPDSEQEVNEVASLGFKTLITLTELPHPAASKLSSEPFGGISCHHIPISDGSTPSEKQVLEFCRIIIEANNSSAYYHHHQQQGEQEKEEKAKSLLPALVHCHLGSSRTGLFLSFGMFVLGVLGEADDATNQAATSSSPSSPSSAILKLHRKVRKESVLTTKQERFFCSIVDAPDAKEKLVLQFVKKSKV